MSLGIIKKLKIGLLNDVLIEDADNEIQGNYIIQRKYEIDRVCDERSNVLERIGQIRKSYKTKKAQDLVGLVLFLLLYLVFCAPRGIFEFRSCILPCFSKNRT